ncbi:MAG: ATP-binding protein [Myxococcales bacterium]|nr:ATP-binding protein [Myxococcota bacterium]MDW8283950.1 ATP-binding protein [Myxococcales bacterium]
MNPPSQAALLQATLRLAKDLSLDLSEETIGERVLATLSGLLPGRALCLRVLGGQRHETTSVFCHLPQSARGQVRLLPEAERGVLLIKRSALRHTGLPEDIATSARVRLVDRHVAVFEGTSGGFSVPLVASGELLGMLNCEYPLGGKPVPEGLRRRDEAAVIPLCNQVSVALRNLRLLHRARSYDGYLRRMIDAASALVVVVDGQGQLTIVNGPMEQVSGYRAGIGLSELLEREQALGPGGEPDRPGEGMSLARLLQRALQGQECEGVEVLLSPPGGPPVRAVFNVTALRDATGSIDGAAAMGQDLERVRSLERQVLQAERLATIGQLAAGLVHELNNPLSSIAAYGAYLARRLEAAGPGFQADAERARRICEGAERLQRLTRDLMAYGRPTGEMEPLQVPEVVQQALSLCEHVLSRSGVQMQTSFASGLPMVRGVRTQLQQVVVNLLTNACHAIESRGNGQGQIQVRVSPATLGNGPAVLLSVRDTGPGIPEAYRARVFEPFFSTKAAGQGTGLGLAIVKNIVEGHGGQVSFETTTGRGTCFLVLLPAMREGAPEGDIRGP